MNIPNKFPTYTKYNAVEVMKTVEGLIDCVKELEARLAVAEGRLAKCEGCCSTEGGCEKKATVKKTDSK